MNSVEAAAKIQQLRQRYAGPMTEEEIAFLHDVQAFIGFCIRGGLSYQLVLGTLAHDINGLLRGEDMMPKVAGYSATIENLDAASSDEKLKEELGRSD